MNNANGDLIMSANKVILRNQAGTDPVVLASDKITTTILPECSATPSSANQLVNKTYADTKVSKSGDETIAGSEEFHKQCGCRYYNPAKEIHIHVKIRTISKLLVTNTGSSGTSDGNGFGVGTSAGVAFLNNYEDDKLE